MWWHNLRFCFSLSWDGWVGGVGATQEEEARRVAGVWHGWRYDDTLCLWQTLAVGGMDGRTLRFDSLLTD